MWQECKWNIWSSSLFLTLNKVLTKPAWITKSWFYFLSHWFFIFSYKLQELLHKKVATQVCFCEVAGENRKELLPEILLILSKKISLTDVFIILQLSANDFRVRTKGKNSSIKRSSRRSDILTLLTLPSANAKSAVLLRVPSSTKAQVRNFPLLHFPKWLYLVHRQLAMSLRGVKMPMFLSLWYSTMVLITTFSVTEIYPWRDSVKCQLLCLYS